MIAATVKPTATKNQNKQAQKKGNTKIALPFLKFIIEGSILYLCYNYHKETNAL